MKGHFRPKRSAQRPKINDPTDRNMRTSVIPQVICVFDLWKAAASGVTVKLTVKKSKASQHHPNQATCDDQPNAPFQCQ